MKKNDTLKENLYDFIEERLNQCYSDLRKNSEYKKLQEENNKIYDKIIEKVKDEKLIEEYEKAKIHMQEMEINEAYKTGFKDSTILLSKAI